MVKSAEIVVICFVGNRKLIHKLYGKNVLVIPSINTSHVFHLPNLALTQKMTHKTDGNFYNIIPDKIELNKVT